MVPNTVRLNNHGMEDLSAYRVALVGRFGGMNQRQAANVLRSCGATVVDVDSDRIDWVVIGAEESPLAEAELLSRRIHAAAATGRLEVLPESELWQRLGLVDTELITQRYYTPAMLAHLLGVSVGVIRRWHRRGLIRPVHTVHRLPYFDFQEVATARRLAQWIADGDSPAAIEQRLVDLIEVLPNIQRPLDQLSILIEGKHVLLRHGEGLLEPGGQLRFDFDACQPPSSTDEPAVLSFAAAQQGALGRDATVDPLLAEAYAAEEHNEIELAIDHYHAILARDGPRADISFQIAELLYRSGQVTAARERYYAAIESAPDHLEARASLGCVLAELQQHELAIAAFRGALSLHEDYAEVHYHAARALDALERTVESRHHWQRFRELAPESPWASEAAERIDEIDAMTTAAETPDLAPPTR